MADGSLIFDTKIDGKGFNDGMSKLKSVGTKSMQAVGKAIIAAGAVVAGMGGYALKASIDFESAFAGVRKTIDGTEKDFAMLEKGIRDMSKVMPQSASEIAGVAEAAGQLGIQTENVLGFTETMVMLGDATNMSSEEAATALARLANITGMSQTDFDRLGSTVVELGNNLATTEGEIVEMGLRLAGTASQVGLTEHEMLALAGAMSSVGINAEAGGSSMSRVMQKMNTEVLSGGKNLQGFADIAGMSADEFSKAWKENPTQAIQSFVEGLDKVNESGGDVTSTLKELGINSTVEIDTLSRLAGASDVLADALGMSAEAWKENTALADEAVQKYETTESQLLMLKNVIDDLAISVGDGLKESAVEGIGTAIDMVEQLANAFEVGGIAGLVEELGTVFADLATMAAEAAPRLMEAGANMIMSFITGIRENIPAIVESALNILQTFITSIAEMLPEIIALGAELLVSLLTGIAEMLPELTTQAIDLVIGIADTIIENLPLIIEAGLQLIVALAQGLIDNLPKLIEEVPRIINSFAGAIYDALPEIIKAGIEIIGALIKGLINAIPTLIANIPQIIMAIVNVVTLYNWANLGKSVITKLGEGIKSMTGNISATASNLANSVGTTITNIFKGGLNWGKGLISNIGQGFSSMLSYITTSASSLATSVLDAIKGIFAGGFDIGKNLIQGLWDGIVSLKESILDGVGKFAGNILDAFKDKFGIASPAKVMEMYGKWIDEGLAIGIEKNADKPISATENMANAIGDALSKVNGYVKTTSSIIEKEFQLWVLQNDAVEESSEYLEKQLEMQEQQHILLNEQVDATIHALENAVVTYGETSKEALQYKSALLDLQIQQENLKDSVDKTNKSLQTQWSLSPGSNAKDWAIEVEGPGGTVVHSKSASDIAKESSKRISEKNDRYEENYERNNPGKNYQEEKEKSYYNTKYPDGRPVYDKDKKMIQYARGTLFHPGGLALVGEEGPEVVDLPRGSKVHTNQDSKRMIGDLAGAVRMMTNVVRSEVAGISSRMAPVSSGSKNITNNNDNGITQNVTIVSPEGTPSENARQLKKVGKELALGY